MNKVDYYSDSANDTETIRPDTVQWLWNWEKEGGRSRVIFFPLECSECGGETWPFILDVCDTYLFAQEVWSHAFKEELNNAIGEMEEEFLSQAAVSYVDGHLMTVCGLCGANGFHNIFENAATDAYFAATSDDETANKLIILPISIKRVVADVVVENGRKTRENLLSVLDDLRRSSKNLIDGISRGVLVGTVVMDPDTEANWNFAVAMICKTEAVLDSDSDSDSEADSWLERMSEYIKKGISVVGTMDQEKVPLYFKQYPPVNNFVVRAK